MSLDKAIASGKEWRKEYRKSKAVDRTCRNHGSCPYCAGNRLRKYRVEELNRKDALDYVSAYDEKR